MLFVAGHGYLKSVFSSERETYDYNATTGGFGKLPGHNSGKL